MEVILPAAGGHPKKLKAKILNVPCDLDIQTILPICRYSIDQPHDTVVYKAKLPKKFKKIENPIRIRDLTQIHWSLVNRFLPLRHPNISRFNMRPEKFYKPNEKYPPVNLFHPLIAMDLPIQHGSSGGPVFDKNGELVGIISGFNEHDPSRSYAVPVNLLQNAWKQFNLHVF